MTKHQNRRVSATQDPQQKKLDPSAIRFDERLRYSIPEASALLRQSRAKTYLDIRAGLIRVIRDGARTYVPGSEILKRSAIPA